MHKRSRPLTGCSGVAALLVGLLAGGARAEEPRARLEYRDATGLPGCPDEAALRRGVAARLGRSPFADEAPRLVRVSIAAGPNGLIGRVESLEDGRPLGEREVPTGTRDCAGLTEALQLAVAIAIDPVAAMRPPPEPAPAPVAAPEPVAELAPLPATRVRAPIVQPPPPPPPKPAEETWTGHVAGGVDLGLGQAPGLAPGFSLELGWTGWTWGFAAEARYALRGSGVEGPGTIGLSLGWLAGSACRAWWAAEACVVAGGGLQWADGRGLTTDASARAPLAFAGARVAWRPRLLWSLFLRLEAQVLVPFTPVTLRVSDTPIWSTSPVIFVFGPRFGREL